MVITSTRVNMLYYNISLRQFKLSELEIVYQYRTLSLNDSSFLTNYSDFDDKLIPLNSIYLRK